MTHRHSARGLVRRPGTHFRAEVLGLFAYAFVLLANRGAQAQESTTPPSGAFPPEQPPAEPAPAPPPPGSAPPPTYDQQPPPPAYQQQPPQQQPPPAYEQGSAPPAYQQQGYPPPGYQSPGYAMPPPPPEKPQGEGFEMPPWSVRIDPFNWLLEGRLGLELEVGLNDYFSVELVPVFVVNDQPPMLNFSGIEDTLHQESNGLGALAGSSLSLGIWPEGKGLKGYVLRAILTNYGYSYETRDDAGVFDQLDHTERHFYGYFGSHSRIGAFTIAGGIGLGVELNQQERCFPVGAMSVDDVRTSDCEGELQIALDRNVETIANVNSPMHPVQIMGRISLGVTID